MSRFDYLFALMDNPSGPLTAREVAKIVGVSADRVYWHMVDLWVLDIVVVSKGRPKTYSLSPKFVDKMKSFVDLSKEKE